MERKVSVTEKTSEMAGTHSSSAGSSSSETALVTQHGRTTITDAVVSKIAGISTRDVAGVYALGGGAARAVGAIRERIPGSRTNHGQGVSVEVGERQAANDVEIVAEYGVAIADLAEAVRRNVIASLERMTGLEVTEVNVTMQDVHLESDDSSDESDDKQSQQS